MQVMNFLSCSISAHRTELCFRNLLKLRPSSELHGFKDDDFTSHHTHKKKRREGEVAPRGILRDEGIVSPQSNLKDKLRFRLLAIFDSVVKSADIRQWRRKIKTTPTFVFSRCCVL